MTYQNTPVLDTLAVITAASVENCKPTAARIDAGQDRRLGCGWRATHVLLLNAGTAADAGITLEDVQGILIAVGPIIGTARTVAAAASITKALGFAVAVAEAELEAEAEAV